MNKPISTALKQVYLQPATTPVRRVLAYVNPLPSGAPTARSEAAPGTGPTPPSLGTVLSKAVIGVRSVESLAQDLEGLQAHNRHVRNYRESQDVLAESLHGHPDQLMVLARSLYDVYRRTREQGGITHIVECVVSKSPDNPRGRVDDLNTLEEVLAETMAEVSAPWVPPEWRAPHEAPGRRWRSVVLGHLRVLEGIAATVLDLLNRVQLIERVAGPGGSSVGGFRSAVHTAILQATNLRSADGRYWEGLAEAAFEQVAVLSNPTSDVGARAGARAALREWARTGMAAWLAVLPDPTGTTGAGPGDARVVLRNCASLVAGTLVGARASILDVLERVPDTASRALKAKANAARSTLEMLAPADSSTDHCLRSLLALEVVHGVLRTPDRGVDQAVELFQVSAATPNALRTAPSPEDKLNGAQLFHFGAFYKRSWRYNDWMWGRLDGALRMVQLLLEPARFAQVIIDTHPLDAAARRPELGCELIHKLAIADETVQDRREVLAQYWDTEEEQVLQELAFLADPELPAPSSLPRCTRVLARRLQLEVVCTEMPMVQAAVRADELDRDDKPTSLDDQPAMDPVAAVRALAACDVGKEQLLSEVGTNRFLSATTQAGVVTTSALENPEGGLGPVSKVVRPLRGLSLALDWVTAGVTQTSPGAVAAFISVLAVSGAILTVVLATGQYTKLPAVATLVVLAVLIIGTLVWARRVGFKLVTMAILIVVVIGVGLLVFPAFTADARSDGLRSALLVARPFLLGLILVGGLLLLGVTGQHVKPVPAPTAQRIVKYATYALVVLLIVGVGLGIYVERARSSRSRRSTTTVTHAGRRWPC